jgi:hypothetical protein
MKRYMKFCSILAAAWLGSSLLLAQQPEKPQVLFSGPAAQTRQAPAAMQPASPNSAITDAERRAIVITAWNLDVHLTPRDESMEAHARVTLRNDGSAALSAIPLQLSSTLKFEGIGLGGQRLAFSQTTVASDADHTGALHEAVIVLPTPLAPAGELTLDVDYGGAIPLSAARLTAIDAPASSAEASDWDRISADFTGLRGFGNVVWYPVSSIPVSMGNGDTLFMEIGRQKLLDQGATITLRVTDEFFSEPPNAVMLNGHFVTCDKPAAMPTAAFPGVVTCLQPAMRLGFAAPSLFLARRKETDSNGLRVLSLPGNAAGADADADTEANIQDYVDAAGKAQPLLRSWFGTKPHALFTILALPEPDDAPAETGEVLATPLNGGDAARLAPIVVDGLARAAFSSPRAWLNEGVANFLDSLWIDSTDGRTAAMENLNADRPALAIAEPGTPGQGNGQDLLHAVSAVYYRTKATYVLWMLRNIAGDRALAAALQAYNPAQDTTPDDFERLVERSSGKDLHWFFDNWVYHDRGLPDLSIGSVFSSPEVHQQNLVAIEMANDGYADVEVPVTVRGANTEITQEVLVPARGRVTHRLTFQENPTEVDVNDGSVPEVQDSIHKKFLVPKTSASQ